MHLKRLGNTFTAGPDGIPSFLVRDCAVVFAPVLCRIYNLALSTCCFPNVWKEARVTPVHKSGDRARLSNYRPISILSNFAKVFEMIMYGNVFDSVKDLICPEQHGFFKGRSTIKNLATFTKFLDD